MNKLEIAKKALRKIAHCTPPKLDGGWIYETAQHALAQIAEVDGEEEKCPRCSGDTQWVMVGTTKLYTCLKCAFDYSISKEGTAPTPQTGGKEEPIIECKKWECLECGERYGTSAEQTSVKCRGNTTASPYKECGADMVMTAHYKSNLATGEKVAVGKHENG